MRPIQLHTKMKTIGARMELERKFREIVYRNIYLHFFNREIYRGIYGERIEYSQINQSDIMATIILSGNNMLLASYSAFCETINMLSDKGKMYRELKKAEVLRVSGETLNTDMIIDHKQQIYFHLRDKYPGYFNTSDLRELNDINPDILKPDVTDKLESFFLNDDWNPIINSAPTNIDRTVIINNKESIKTIIKNRDNKAITKALFQSNDKSKDISGSAGRTLTGLYIDDYNGFITGDIVTGVPGVKEYDFLSKDFPAHDYEILKELLIKLGLPKHFSSDDFYCILSQYDSREHTEFAIKIQSLLFLVIKELPGLDILTSIEQKRLYIISAIRSKLAGITTNTVDMRSSGIFEQCLDNVNIAIKYISDSERNEVKKVVMENKKVFVVTGRNEKLRLSIFNILRALKLEPMEWMEVIQASGQPSSYLNDAIKTSIDNASAIVVIMAPEDEAQLVEKYQTDEEDKKPHFQPRPNVIFEAGLALGIKEEKTIILQFGTIQIFSDILGKHILKYKGKANEVNFKNDFYQKLKIAGCNCYVGNDYYSIPIDYE